MEKRWFHQFVLKNPEEMSNVRGIVQLGFRRKWGCRKKVLCILRKKCSDTHSKGFKDSRSGFQRNLRHGSSDTLCILQISSLRAAKRSKCYFKIFGWICWHLYESYGFRGREKFLIEELGLLQNNKISPQYAFASNSNQQQKNRILRMLRFVLNRSLRN